MSGVEAMHEPLLERIQQLERSVQRWRLACFALLIVVISLLAIGATFGVIMILDPNPAEIEILQVHAARDQAEEAMQAERVARHEAERALQAERAARQKIEEK